VISSSLSIDRRSRIQHFTSDIERLFEDGDCPVILACANDVQGKLAHTANGPEPRRIWLREDIDLNIHAIDLEPAAVTVRCTHAVR